MVGSGKIRSDPASDLLTWVKLQKDTDGVAAICVRLSRVKRSTDLIILRHFDYKVLLIKPSKSQIVQMQRLDKLFAETPMHFSECF
ncbi:unnamed protein product [Adineta ricciae]|uniref:Uncharacterized protein n=1 Tax=Adineta ricciae TaxID=249248 RepID=A0A815M1R2_ADIRI|nr:unnamed protein product [Adineta ricciae]CAF1418448.1 unnamed protein product [Adineta ricciae]